jgi:exoribonuclease R
MKKEIKKNASQIITAQISTNKKGIGYIKDPNNLDKDIIIESISLLNTAMNGDIVEAKLGKKNQYGQITAEVTKIIERKRNTFVCTIENQNGKLLAIPDDKKAYFPISIIFVTSAVIWPY